MTIRTLVAVLVFAALSGWVSGQGPAPRRTADEEATLLKKNRQLLEGLLDDGLELSASDTALDRAAACRRAADRLAFELATAVRHEDTDRMIEIGGQFTTLLNEGFLPPFGEAQASIAAGSPEFPRLQALHAESASRLKAVSEGLPTTGKLAGSRSISELRKKLNALSEQIGSPKE